MNLPVVAIVGRPNVGKSTLFNRLSDLPHRAIVSNQPGLTRDRNYTKASWGNRDFSLIDTGGLAMTKEDYFHKAIERQVKIAINEADVIVFVVDCRAGLEANDHMVADMLRKVEKPVVLAVNKCDSGKQLELLGEFYGLGIKNVLGISAEHGLGIGDLLDAFTAFLPEFLDGEQAPLDRVCIVGKPNVGKSSLFNRLIGEERAIVTEIPGTTRDALDTVVNDKYSFVDTAGLRKSSKIDDDVEYYSTLRTLERIRRSDLVILMIDLTGGTVSTQDQKIAAMIEEAAKASIVLFNKADLCTLTDQDVNDLRHMLTEKLSYIDYSPMLFISALSGRGVDKIFPTIDRVLVNYRQDLDRKKLNAALSEMVERTPPRMVKGHRPKIGYTTQIGTSPPSIALFKKGRAPLAPSYMRYLKNNMRKHFELTGTPLRIAIRDV